MKKIYLIIIFTLGLNNIGYNSEVELLTAYQENNPPRYFKQGNMDRGICVDILKAINQKLKSKHIRILANESYPLPRIANMMKNNKIQMFIGLTHDSMRNEQFVFGKIPLYELQMVFAKNANDQFKYRGPKSLRGKIVGTLRGATSSQQMKEIQGVSVEEVTTMKQNLLKLHNKRIDLVYYHHIGLLWDIKENGYDNQIVLTKNIFETKFHYIMFAESVSRSVIDMIDNAVAELHAEGEIKRILAAYR